MPAYPKLRWLACVAAILLTACGGGGGSGDDVGAGGGAPGLGSGTAMSYAVTNLVSDSGAGNPNSSAHTDAHLVNPWGVVFNPSAFVWVANNGTSSSTLYDGNGVPQTLVVAIPPGNAGTARPTGIVFNGNSQSFKVTQGSVSGGGIFIFAGEAGTISGWSPTVNSTNAITAVNDGAAGAVYKGLAIASRGGSDFLYATDFRHATVNVFDATFARVSVAGAFTDSALPAGFAPYGIQTLNGLIYVAYARQDASATSAVAGAGLCIVDVFDTAGNLMQRLIPAGGA
ncbi:MAG TPA: TIGR03118 family protein, partial [Ramlibacter sp.]|nr:TIGR03118 family protein [Ramlibacter sp.]